MVVIAIQDYPFLLALLAASLAGVSAILLRRARRVFGQWLGWLAGLSSILAILTFAWSFGWAWIVERPVEQGMHPLTKIAALLLILMGTSLAGWAAMMHARRTIRSWNIRKLRNQLPYNKIRRPIELGAMLVVLGITLLIGTKAAWICYLISLVAIQVLLELNDWEIRVRDPVAAEYQRGTPRYLPDLR
jgi:protein-S-isoprenylcysteine O-methyltransferase Ste14